MRFDAKNLEPLFQLEIGKPGSSFALEIAQKIGLPKVVTSRAKEKLGKDRIDVEKLLRELEVEKKLYRDKMSEISDKEQYLKRSIQEYDKLREFISTHKKQLLNEAKAEAKGILRDANQKIENAIRHIKESNANRDVNKQVRKDLEDFKEKLVIEQVEPIKSKDEDDEVIEIIGGEIQVGDYVKIIDQEALAEVLAIKNKEVTIQIGELKSNIKLNRLVKISKKEYKKTVVKSSYTNYGVDLNEKRMEFTFEIDVRGMRAEEVLPKVEQFIDNAIMLNYQELRILHGKGDGILRQIIRDRLKKYKAVANLQDEHADRGGSGVTIVTLK
jgi:DNA mismatch repair protein MutS2